MHLRILLWISLGSCCGFISCTPRVVSPENWNNSPLPSSASARVQIEADSNLIPPTEQQLLQKIFTQSIESACANDPQMTFRIQVDPHFEQHFVWPWFLGIWIPGWPMTPRQGSIALNLQVQILSQGKIHHRIQLTEVEPFDLFWYGIYRDFPLQEKSDFVVRKVQSSLKSLLSSQFCNETPDGVPIW